ncbi:unnamed protein product [Spirodela intermedia]|uniref:Uncharacterized protein n=1 Tax=Spirodela intermedia TaxID=51605 RepID=A0A7I8J1M0_SPIIN|nr:unnamed protein product [Spirodela intermedia]CAA6664058.1 unnamed protein product [Spirodela intermedia]
MLDGGGAHVRSFILKSAHQEEALYHICTHVPPLVQTARALLVTTPSDYASNPLAGPTGQRSLEQRLKWLRMDQWGHVCVTPLPHH